MKHCTVSLDKRRPLKDGSFPVVLIVKNVGRSFRYSTGVHVKDCEYNEGVIVKRSDKNQLNHQIQALVEKVEDLITNKHITDEVLTRILHGRDDVGTFYIHYQRFLKKKLTTKTRESYVYTMQMLSKYCKFQTLSFDEMDYAWLSNLEVYLRKSGVSVNTVKIHMTNIRAVFNDALNEEVTDKYPFRRYRIKRERTIQRSLTLEQLNEWHNCYDRVETYRHKYLDYFFLMFYLIGINAKDLFELTDDSIHGDRIEYKRSKTHGIFSIKITPQAKELIDRMRTPTRLIGFDNYHTAEDLRLKVNKNLKEMSEKFGLQRVTTYWTRHTWATLAAELDIPDDTIALALGHQGVSPVTDRYIRRNYQKIDDANERVCALVR